MNRFLNADIWLDTKNLGLARGPLRLNVAWNSEYYLITNTTLQSYISVPAFLL